MENEQITKIRKIVCNEFCIEEPDLLNKSLRNHIMFAKYMFSFFAFSSTLNKIVVKDCVGATDTKKIDEYMRKHHNLLTDSNYRRIAERVERRINEI